MFNMKGECIMINKSNALFHGPASEVITPFAEDGSVDYTLLANEITFMLDHGVTGFFVNGLASEALVLSPEEREECARVVCNLCKGKVPVMGNIIANSVADGVKIAQSYVKVGCDAIIITLLRFINILQTVFFPFLIPLHPQQIYLPIFIMLLKPEINYHRQ